MYKKLIAGGLASLLALVVTAVAIAAGTAADTLLTVTVKASPTTAGTKAKPKSEKLTFTFAQKTKSGTGQPGTTTKIDITLPKEFKINSGKWPKKDRCDGDKADQSGKSVCPAKSKVGSGKSQAKALDGAIIQNLDVTAYVLTSGGIGFFVEGQTPVQVASMLPAKVSSHGLSVSIPSNIQEPVTGAPTGITLLNSSVGGKDGDVNLIESTGCKKKWTFTGKFTYRDGTNSGTSTVACKS